MRVVFDGIAHGRSIELNNDAGLPDGQPVHVIITPINSGAPQATQRARELLQSAAGMWCDDPEGLEEFLEWNRQQRKSVRREIVE